SRLGVVRREPARAHLGRPRVGTREAEEDAQRRGLAGAVGADDRERLAGLDRERQRVHREHGAVALGERRGAHHAHARLPAASPARPARPATAKPAAAAQSRGGWLPASSSRTTRGAPGSGARDGRTRGKRSTASLGRSDGNTRSATASEATAGLFASTARSGYCFDTNANAETGANGTSLTPSPSRSNAAASLQ